MSINGEKEKPLFNLIIFRMEREDQQNIKSFNGESWNSDEKMQQSL